MFTNASRFVVRDGTFNEVHGDLNLSQTSKGLSGLQILYQATVGGATHDSSERFPPPKCHPQTRRAIIADILGWIRDSSRHTSILWLNGPAGAGKSSIAQTIAEECSEQGIEQGAGSRYLAASFFFSRTSPGRNSAQQIFPTIAYQLALTFPSIKLIIGKVVEGDPSVLTKSMDLQFSRLILEPMRFVEYVPSESKAVIIDGLDECEGEDIQAYIIKLIGRACDQRLPVCFLIASRPEPHIRDAFDIPIIRRLCRRLVLDESFRPDKDIRVFLQTSFSEIHGKHRWIMQSVPTPWPSDADISTLVARSSGQFIYAATVVKFVGERGHRPTDRLRIILDMSPLAKASNAFAELDCLYSQILYSSTDIALTLRVLGALMAIPSGFSKGVVFLEDLLLLQQGDAYLALSSLHSLLNVPEPEQLYTMVTSYHKSFFDFLVDSQRSKAFFIDISTSHTNLATLCLRELTKPLNDKYQGCNKEIRDYAYYFWCFHCIHAYPDPELLDDLQRVVIFGVDYQVTFLVKFSRDFPKVIDWLAYNSSLKAQAIYQGWSSALDGYFTQCLNRCIYQEQILSILGLWLFNPKRPSVPPMVSIDFYLDSSLSALQTGFYFSRVFLEFLQDPLRSGKYNVNPTVCARITVRLLELGDSGPLCSADRILLDSYHYWTSILIHSAPTPELLSILRVVPLEWPMRRMYSFSQSNGFQVVLDWLEKIDPPPLDVIQCWRDL